MVLVHTDRHIGPGFDRGFDHVFEEGFTGVLTGARRSLHDDRGVDFCGGGHDGLNLLNVVDVEGRYAVTVFGCMIQQLTHAHKCHLRNAPIVVKENAP